VFPIEKGWNFAFIATLPKTPKHVYLWLFCNLKTDTEFCTGKVYSITFYDAGEVLRVCQNNGDVIEGAINEGWIAVIAMGIDQDAE